MRKLTLNLQDLTVESFVAGSKPSQGGTVKAHTGHGYCMPDNSWANPAGCFPVATAQFTSCEPCGPQYSLGQYCTYVAFTCEWSACHDTCYGETCGDCG